MRIKDILKEKGISQKEFAEKLGMSEVGFSIAISDTGNTSKKTLQNIADLLNVSVAELFEPKQAQTSTIICPKCNKIIKIEVITH